MDGILHQIAARIKKVFENWHGHVDPDAAIRNDLVGFVQEAATLVHGLESKLEALAAGVAPESADFVRKEVEKIGKQAEQVLGQIANDFSGLVGRVIDLEGKVAALTTVTGNIKAEAMNQTSPDSPAQVETAASVAGADQSAAAQTASDPALTVGQSAEADAH